MGFIGDHYQRFYIQFISVIQDPKNRKAYFVYGKTKVKANICSFQGTFKLIDARYYNHGDDPKVKQGFIVGSYELYEDSDKSGTGVLKGTFKTEFYIDAKGKPQYDAISFVADGYCNNQFEGTWTSYRNGETKKCNWGDYRIPGSKDLDVGTGEFAPSQSYRENVWQDYFLSVISSPDSPEAQEAKRREKVQWWRE